MAGVGFPGSCSTSPAAPFQPQAKLEKATGFGDTEVPMELAQRTNPQCSTRSESSAKAHPPETLTALFYRAPALHHSAGKRCVLDLPLAKPRPAREQGQRPDLAYTQKCPTQGGDSFFSWRPVEVKDALRGLGEGGRSAAPALGPGTLPPERLPGHRLPLVNSGAQRPHGSESAS